MWNRIRHSQAHTNSQDRDLSRKVPDGIAADTGVSLGVSWARTDDKLSGIDLDQFLDGDLVVPEDVHGCPLEHQILVDVPGERVIVVNEHQIGRCGNRCSRLRLVRRVVNDFVRGHFSEILLPQSDEMGYCVAKTSVSR